MIVYAIQSAVRWVRRWLVRLGRGNVPSPAAGSAAADPTPVRSGAQAPSAQTLRWQTAADSRIVEEQYRLRPADLSRGPLTVQIRSVSYQGVEQVRLVLHFAETRKTLALNTEQCRDLIRSTGSGHIDAWIDQTIQLSAGGVDGEIIIRTASVKPAP